MRACAPLHFVPPCRPVFARRRAAFARSRSAAATTLALDTCPARTLLTMEIDTPLARATCARSFLRPSPIGAAALDHHGCWVARRPPLTRAPVHDDLDVLPSAENASNLVFEMGMRPTDDDAGHPRAFSSPRVCGGDLQQKRGQGFQRYSASRRGRRTVDLSPRWIAVSVDWRV